MSTKRILSLVLALVMVLGTFGTVFAAEPTGNPKVDWLVEQGYVLGDAGGLRLEDGITRAEVSVIVAKALGLEAEAAAMANIPSKFSDMRTAGYAWANGFVNVLNANGYISGYPDGTFGPAKDITYAEVASMLVRVMGGLTEAEAKTAVWPTTYLAKAASLGIFEGVAGVDYSAKAVRGKIFEMVYNTLDKEVGTNTVVKAIVLENNRLERLGKDEIVVEILKVEQVANYAKESRVEKGQQIAYVIDAKLGNVENLLGQVANFTINKDGKVIKITPDTSYKVVSGPATATRNKIDVDGTSYTVELDERYKGTDERIFRTYHNDKAYSYVDFYENPLTKPVEDKFVVDYARVTVKNGKVLLIDAYSFDDIAPVQEVKKDGAEVYVYNDNRDARVELYKPATVIGYTEKDGFKRITKADIKVNDVVHVYNTDSIIVRQDTLVQGTYEKVSEGKINTFYAHIDGTKYLMNSATLRKPVYSYDSKAFMTLEPNRATSLLRDFKDEKVTALIDINGHLQYFGSSIEFNEGMAMIDEVLSRGDVRFVKPSNDKVVLSETFDSEFEINGTTRNNNLKDFNRGDLVFLENDGDNIASMVRLATAQGIYGAAKLVNKPTATSFEMSESYIRLAGETGRYNVLPRTNVFLLTMDGSKADTITGTTITKIKTNIDLDSNTLRAYVITDKQIYDEDLGRTLISNRNDVAHTIVFVDRTAVAASYDYETIRVSERFVAGRDRQIVGKDQYGETIVRDVHKNVTTNYNIGDIVRIGITKDEAKVVRTIDLRVVYDQKTFKVKSMTSFTGYRSMVLVDANGNEETFWTTSNVIEFGRVAKDDLIAIWTTGDFKDIGVIKVVGTGNPTATFDGSNVLDPVVENKKLELAYQLANQIYVKFAGDSKEYAYYGAKQLSALQLMINELVVAKTHTIRGEEVVIEIDEAVEVASITLAGTTTGMKVGDTVQLTATLTPANATDTRVVWTSDAPSIATVDATGKVTAVAIGSFNITAKPVYGTTGLKATQAGTVVATDVSGVTLNKTALTLEIGQNETLAATVLPTGATNKAVTWTSGTSAVATVDVNGKITALTAGTSVITVTTTDGSLTATATVTVKPVKPVAVLAPATNAGTKLTITGYVNTMEYRVLDAAGNVISTWADPTTAVVDDIVAAVGYKIEVRNTVATVVSDVLTLVVEAANIK